jgi:hypothetical protein
LRKRLLSIVGAFGLVAGLLTSAVGVQAGTTLPDTKFNSLVATYSALSSSGGTACIDNGQSKALAADGSCNIMQGPGQTNVAICVEYNSPRYELCRITQTNTDDNNYALVFQLYNQQGGSFQNAVQYGVVVQHNGTGSNLLGEFQVTNQFTNDPGASQTQKAQQYLGSDFDPTTQASTAGSNYALFDQNSNQTGTSETAPTQDQNSNDVGVLNQTDYGATVSGAVSKNVVIQTQFQALHGKGGQTQTVDPKCCSVQGNALADRFNIAQFTTQWAGPFAIQNATSIGRCVTTGNCVVNQSSWQDGLNKTNSCSGTTCNTGFTCTTFSEGGTFQSCSSPPCVECAPQPPCPPICSPLLRVARLIDRAPAGRVSLTT